MARAAAMPPSALRARRVAEARRDVLSSMVPEGAEDNVDALQRAVERLEADAARTRRDLLVAASRVLGDPEGSHRVSVADSDARDARVVAALADIVPRGGETSRASLATPGDGVADARANGTADGAASGSGAVARPAWEATSDAATREEDTALSDAAAALREARSRRDVHAARAARRTQASLSASAADDAGARLRVGDLAGAAAAAAAAASAAADLKRALAASLVEPLGAVRGDDEELERSNALTRAAEALAETVRDAVEGTVRAAARAVRDDDDDAASAADGTDAARRFVVDPDALESVWRAISDPVTEAVTETVTDAVSATAARGASPHPVFPPTFVARLVQTLSDELAMELFLPLADAAAGDDALVAATVEARGEREVVFTWRARVRASGIPSDSETASALASALDRALEFVGRHARLAGRPNIAGDALGSVWEAVAAAVQSRWFDDDAEATRVGSESTQQTPRRLSDEAVARLCAAEATAAALGASPSPPAVGPVELAAFERERRAAEAVCAAALAEAARLVAEGERLRATARAGGGGVGSYNAVDPASESAPDAFPDDASAAESEEAAAFAAYARVGERVRGGPLGPTDERHRPRFPRTPFPACSVSVSVARLGGLVAATLARAPPRRRGAADPLDARATARAATPAERRATRAEADTAERTACDIVEYWRATVPALRSPGEPDAAAAIAAGGPAAAATFRNDAYFLASRFAGAAYAFGFARAAPASGDDGFRDAEARSNLDDSTRDVDASPARRTPQTAHGACHHPNLLWVVPPLLRLGDDVLDAVVLAATNETAAHVAEFGRRFARGLEHDTDAEEATRALRRARRCLGTTIGAFENVLPEPIAVTHAAPLLSGYARSTLAGVFAATDVSRDARERARDAIREAFSSEGVFVSAPDRDATRGTTSETSPDARRAAARAAFDATLARAPLGARAAWRKGAAAASLFEASLGDIDAGLSDGRWARLGFEPGEIRALVYAVFEHSQRRRAVLERLT